MRGLLLAGLTIVSATTALSAEPTAPGSYPPGSYPPASYPTGGSPSSSPAAPAAPASPTPADRVASPYWNGGSYISGSTDLPAADIRAVPPARAAAVQARWTYEQLQTDLNSATRVLMLQLEGREDYRRAITNEKNAYDALETARRDALRQLEDNTGYTANETLRKNLTEQIKEAYYEPKPDEARIQAMARLKLDYIASNRKLEQDALARDATYQDARQRYVAAADQVNEIRHAHTLAVATDENLQALRHQIADAKIARVTTAAYLQSTIRARNIAVDYALSYRNYDRYHGYGYGASYYPYSYGYGYGRY